MAREKGGGGNKIDSNAWMTTFSDLLNLLLTFFVLLLTMSSLDNKKLKETFGYFDEAVAGLGSRSSAEITPPVRNSIPPILPTSLFKDLKKYLAGGKKERNPKNLDRLRRKLTMLGMEDLLRLQEAIDGLRISMDSDPLFYRGKPDVLPTALPFLSEVARLAKEMDRQVVIECFWDIGEGQQRGDRSVSRELAIARASVLGRLFSGDFGMPGSMVGISAAEAPVEREEGRVRFTYLD